MMSDFGASKARLLLCLSARFAGHLIASRWPRQKGIKATALMVFRGFITFIMCQGLASFAEIRHWERDVEFIDWLVIYFLYSHKISPPIYYACLRQLHALRRAFSQSAWVRASLITLYIIIATDAARTFLPPGLILPGVLRGLNVSRSYLMPRWIGQPHTAGHSPDNAFNNNAMLQHEADIEISIYIWNIFWWLAITMPAKARHSPAGMVIGQLYFHAQGMILSFSLLYCLSVDIDEFSSILPSLRLCDVAVARRQSRHTVESRYSHSLSRSRASPDDWR